MKWINIVYLTLSSCIAFVILYAIINNMVCYHLEDASYYLDMAIEYMKYFLLYVVVNIIFLIILLFKKYFK